MAEQSAGAKQIERLKVGDKGRTARHADVMNELIDQLNAWGSASVSPPESGKFVFSDANVVLDLSGRAGAGTITVTDGTTTLDGITTLNFDGGLFVVSAGGDATTADITLNTIECACTGATIDGGVP